MKKMDGWGCGAHSGSRKTSQEATELTGARNAGGRGDEPSEWADSSQGSLERVL